MLKAREENLESLFAETQSRLTKLSEKPDAYKNMMANLLLEGLFILYEERVHVVARSGDVQLVQGLVDEACKKYKERTGRETKISVGDGLSKDCAGGLVITARNGTISIDNTLEQRLKLLEEKVCFHTRKALC